MSKKFYTVLAPLAAMAAFAIAPAMAQAAPHWYSCEAKAGGAFENSLCTNAGPPNDFEWVRIPEGKPVAVSTKGVLTLHGLGLTFECTVKDAGTIENPAGGGAGTNEITEFQNTGCTVTPETVTCSTPVEIRVLHKGKKERKKEEEKGELFEGKALSSENALPSQLIVVEGVIRDEISEIEVGVRCGATKELVATFQGALRPKIGSSVAEFDAESGELTRFGSPGTKATVRGNDGLEGPTGDLGITAKEP